MSILRKLLMVSAALAVGASTMPQINAGDIEGHCEIPIGNCTPYDGELGCEFCCADFTPAPGSVCHIDLEYSGWCGDEEGKGIIYHCATHDD